MRGKKVYPSFPLKKEKRFHYPSKKNPIILPRSFVSGSAYSVKSQLIELQKKIMANEEIFQRKNDKIPALWFLLPTAYLPEPFISSWCFECFTLIREALRHGIIKNRNDARFWGLKEKKALCGDCLEKRLEQMPTRKKHLWAEYKKRGYWELN